MDLENKDLIYYIKSLIKVFSKNWKSNLFLLLISVPISFNYLSSQKPIYYVSAQLSEIQPSSISVSGSNPLASLLNVSQESENVENFKITLQSLKVAEMLWNKGFNMLYFGSTYNEVSGEFIYTPNSKDRLNKFIFDLDPKKVFDHQDLQNVIKSKVSFQKDINSESIYSIFINTSNPEVDLKLLEAAIYETDRYIKSQKLKTIEEKINFFYKEASQVSDKDTKSALMSLVQQSLLEKSLNSIDSLLYFDVIQEPFIGKVPKIPSTNFTFWAFALILIGLNTLIRLIFKEFV